MIFRCGLANGDALDAIASAFSGPVLVYSRFFFHAIDDAAEEQVIARIAGVLRRRGGAFAVEFRTLADVGTEKVTSSYFRRFIDADRFAENVAVAGLVVTWRAEGRGMAKYRHGDAYVARLLAQPA